MAARLTPDQKVGSSNLSALICHSCRSLAFPHPKHVIPHLTQQHFAGKQENAVNDEQTHDLGIMSSFRPVSIST